MEILRALSLGLFCFSAGAGELGGPVKNVPRVAEASKEGEEMLRGVKLPQGFKAEVVAAEPNLANVVAFGFDERGSVYVSETFRLHAGVPDIRGLMSWLDEDLASRSPDERLAMMKRHMGDNWVSAAANTDRVKLLVDRDGDGKYEASTVFADNFSHALDGLASGVLARKGDVWFANLPNLWFLRDNDGDGKADARRSLHYGFGVRIGFLGHDLHGLTFGPDGRIYFSIGDRGSAVKSAGGATIGDLDAGSVFRCFPDGSGLEVFASGLRNPQELAFDDHGNLFTGDNNSDGGDRARWVYLVEGGDSGWRVGYQHLNEPVSRGPWNAEKLWHPHWEGQAAYLLPPVTNVAAGPSGLAFYPGTGLPEKYKGHFFLVDFRGQRSSGIHSFTTKEKGATFELVGQEEFLWDALPTDVDFGPDGGIYFSDWVQGWGMTGKGRLYRVWEEASAKSAAETKKLMREGMEKRGARELINLLGHPDKRVRQEAQFELADGRGLRAFSEATGKSEPRIKRLHGIWGLWQLGLKGENVEKQLIPLLNDFDAEVRSQAARVAGDLRLQAAYASLGQMLNDAEARPRFFAAMAIGRLGRSDAIPGLLKFAGASMNKEPYLRHAAVMGLLGSNNAEALIKAISSESAQARMAVLLALRRLERAEIAAFLKDSDPLIVVEAARAINDVPVSGATKELAERAGSLAEGAAPELARRVVNANLRFGTESSAKTLAAMAGNEKLGDAVRVGALEALGNWEHLSGRDAITGLWRPVVGRRDPRHAQEALRPVVAKYLIEGPDQVRAAMARAAGGVGLREAADELAGVVTKKSGNGRLRVEALRALAELDLEQLAAALPAAGKDESEEVRREALRLGSRVKSSDPTAPLVAALENGSVGEKQAALAALGDLEAGEKVLGEWLDRVIRGDEPKEIHLDIVQAAAKRPALKERVDKWAASFPADDLLKDLRVALHGGNAAAGRKVFFERADVYCARCHKVGGEGGEAGPDLSGIGAKQTREYLLESIAHPNKVIAKGFENVMVSMKDGTSVAGIVKSESDAELVMLSPEDGEVKIKKGDISKRAVGGSGMPEGLAQLLGPKDLRDLVEFLAAQK